MSLDICLTQADEETGRNLVSADHQILPLQEYDRIVVFFSGGKDATACVLHLLELGVERSKIELHHHLVDGEEGREHFMDWPVTTAYCRAFASAFGLKISFSWKEFGFKGEMLRKDTPTARTFIPVEGQGTIAIGGKGPTGTRCKFPQISASLTTRWCSSYLKISCGDAYINNNDKFLHAKTLVITGERAQESASRAKYKVTERHRTDRRNGRLRRLVDHWRPVHAWTEKQVWDIIARHKVNPHHAYRLGWGRVSCMKCIFGGPNQWASVRVIDPIGFEKILQHEIAFGVTIHRQRNVAEQADRGTPYVMARELINASMSTDYKEPIFVDDWILPAGAFGEGCGPV